VNQSIARILGVVAVVSAAAPMIAAQGPQISGDQSLQAPPPRAEQRAMRVPFGAGERLNFDVRLGTLKVGTSAMEVRGVESIRGRDTWHTVFWVKGGTFFYRVNDIYESWIDTENFSSLRFVRLLEEGTSDREQKYEIYPERGLYVNERNNKPTRTLPTVKQPLDEGSFSTLSERSR
jgi:hypothetical protein